MKGEGLQQPLLPTKTAWESVRIPKQAILVF
jgi:hypothetical protein